MLIREIVSLIENEDGSGGFDGKDVELTTVDIEEPAEEREEDVKPMSNPLQTEFEIAKKEAGIDNDAAEFTKDIDDDEGVDDDADFYYGEKGGSDMKSLIGKMDSISDNETSEEATPQKQARPQKSQKQNNFRKEKQEKSSDENTKNRFQKNNDEE